MAPISGTDLCALGNLDPTTGVFELALTDMDAYPPGTYPVEIQGFISGYLSQISGHIFRYELVDPCSIATI